MGAESLKYFAVGGRVTHRGPNRVLVVLILAIQDVLNDKRAARIELKKSLAVIGKEWDRVEPIRF